MPTTARRTSNYTLHVPAPDPNADVHAALDALIYAAQITGVEVSDSTFTRTSAGPVLSVSYRVADDDTAAALGFQVLAAYGTDPAEAWLHTGYGIHRRTFPLQG